jgi:hypothetical protein
VGLLWTPGYWGWSNGIYLFNVGYWGPTVGFYGGINYGFGYGGFGYGGGYWRGNSFYYNRTVNNFGSVRINNVYDSHVSVNRAAGRASFNGGRGGVHAQPTGAELAAARQSRSGPSASQRSHALNAGLDPANRADVNHGRPASANAAGARQGANFGKHGAGHASSHTAAAQSGEQHGHGGPAGGRADFGGSARGGQHGEDGHGQAGFHSGPSIGGSGPGHGGRGHGGEGGGNMHAPSGGGHGPAGGGGEHHPH